MKLRHLFAAVVASAMAFVACEQETDFILPKLKLGADEITFTKAGGDTTITVSSTRDWTVTIDEETAKWVVVDPVAGKASVEEQLVTVSVLSNEGYNREGVVAFNTGLHIRNLTIKQDGALGAPVVNDGDGTKANPYSASKAQELAAALGQDDKITGVYAKGVVKSIKEISPDFGNATYYITDEAGKAEFYVYRGRGLGNAQFTSTDDLKAGDKVVIYGDLMNYMGDSPQFAQGNYLVELNGVTDDPNGNNNPGGGTSDGSAIYSNNFDKTAAAKNSEGKWPFCDQFDGWKNEAGSGASTVSYTFKSASARATSGNNNIWLPKDGGAYLSIHNISLGNATNLKLSFKAICGSPGQYKKTFDKAYLKVYVSIDDNKWVELAYTHTPHETEFEPAEAAFSVPAGTTSLSITFEKPAGGADGYRIDDVNLTAYDGSDAVAVDFASGTEKEFGTGTAGGDTGGDTPGTTPETPSNVTNVTVAEFNTKPVSTTEWYRLTGTVGGPINTTYGNYDLTDATGTVYVYGTENWSEYSSKLVEGVTVTIVGQRGDYNGKIEVVESYIESLEAGNAGGDNTGGDNTGGDNTGGTVPPAGGDVTGTSLTISRKTMTGFEWTENSYGSQSISDLSTYLSWTINGASFIGSKMCIPGEAAFADFAIQCQGNASDAAKQARFGNTTSLGKITKITVVSHNLKYTPNFNLAIGTEPVVGVAVPTGMTNAESMTTTQDGTTYTTVYTPASDAGYFAIYNNTTGALYFSEVIVEYTAE